MNHLLLLDSLFRSKLWMNGKDFVGKKEINEKINMPSIHSFYS